jgi:hypothetical protein
LESWPEANSEWIPRHGYINSKGCYLSFNKEPNVRVLEGLGSTLYEVEETFAAKLDMGAVLNVVGRPESFSYRVPGGDSELRAAVDAQRLTGDPAGLVGGEKYDSGAYIIRLGDAFQHIELICS